MKKKTILPFIIVMVLTSCTTLKVTSNFDPKVNFSKFKTYNVLPWDNDNSAVISEFDKKRILYSIHEQMVARGYKEVKSGSDISVNAFLILDEKEQAIAYTNHYSKGDYGYYSDFGYCGSGNGIGSQSNYHNQTYTVGTLIIDIFDNSTKKLAWQGIGTGTVDKDPKTKDEEIPLAIAKIFNPYPVKPSIKLR